MYFVDNVALPKQLACLAAGQSIFWMISDDKALQLNLSGLIMYNYPLPLCHKTYVTQIEELEKYA